MFADLLPTRRRACYPKAEPIGPQVIWNPQLRKDRLGVEDLEGVQSRQGPKLPCFYACLIEN